MRLLRTCLVSAAVLSGCAGPELAPPASTHPASPRAPEAPVPPRSPTLDLSLVEPVKPVAPADAQAPEQSPRDHDEHDPGEHEHGVVPGVPEASGAHGKR